VHNPLQEPVDVPSAAELDYLVGQAKIC